MKNERARKEREALEEQLRKEGKLVDESTLASAAQESSAAATLASETPGQDNASDSLTSAEKSANALKELALDEPVQNEEHLQLSLEEDGLETLEALPMSLATLPEPLRSGGEQRKEQEWLMASVVADVQVKERLVTMSTSRHAHGHHKKLKATTATILKPAINRFRR